MSLSLNLTGARHGLRYNPSPQADGPLGALDAGVGGNQAARNRSEPKYNGTGYYVENDEVDNSFSDLQTLFLACFATLVPLIFSVLTAFAVRILWRKYRRSRDCRTYDGVLHQDESADRLSGPGAPLHAHLLHSDKVKSCESQFSITADEIECSGSPVLYSGSSSRTNHASANGSIITMTLKNNHLIVETEERNDGVFVVEVQQGVRREGATPGAAATGEDAALVHNPPERFNDEDKLEEVDEEYYPETTSPKSSPRALKSSNTNTGLSQSTLSITSLDPNPCYQYGNQVGYELGHHGYPVYSGYTPDSPLPRLPTTKPRVTAAVYKQNGRLSSMASLDLGGGLCSDKYARQNNRAAEDPEDPIQEEQRRLGNLPTDHYTLQKVDTSGEANGVRK